MIRERSALDIRTLSPPPSRGLAGSILSAPLLINGFETTVWPYIYHGFLLGLGVFTLFTRHIREALSVSFFGIYVEQKSDFLYFWGYLATAVTLFVTKLVYLTADVHPRWPYKIIFAALIIQKWSPRYFLLPLTLMDTCHFFIFLCQTTPL